jgi:hypothetical protein
VCDRTGIAVGGSYLGGNFWAQPDGNGFSQKCKDSEPDGICDMPYEINSNNIDYLPLTYKHAAVIPATVDVKPDTLNKASQSDENTVTAYIEIPGYDVNAIDVSTVILGTNNGNVPAQLSPTVVDDFDSDGIPDIMVKFDRQAVIGIVDIGNVEVTVSGEIGGDEFNGSDKMVVINEPEQIPEFLTIALPMLSVVEILLIFGRRKK